MSNRNLSRPHAFEQGENGRVLLLLHGTGGDEFDLLQLGKAIDPNASLLSPRGMYLEAGMNRFFERYPDGSFNEQSIDLAVEELADFIDSAGKHYGLEGKELIAVGFSNGANTAAALIVKRPEVLDGAALFGSTMPYKNPSKVDLSKKRIWLANGNLDPYAPNSVSETWVALLNEYGATVKWLSHPGGHQISPVHVAQIAKELARD